VAARLSADPANSVVVLEAGPDHGPEPVIGDRGPYLDDPRRLRGDSTVIRRPGGDPESYLQGFGVGGSSLVNGGIVVGDASGEVTDAADHLLPIEAPRTIGGLGRAVLAASDAAAVVGLVQAGGRRVTAADAFLRPVLDRPNLVVVPGTAAVRILWNGRRAGGVVAADGVEHVADRVVCCAGAIQTPTLLLRSGVDTPGVGTGLQDHPAFAIAVDLADAAIAADAPAIAVSIERPGRQILVIDRLSATDPHLGALMAARTRVTSTGAVTLPDPDGLPLVELRQLATADDVDGLVAVAIEALALLDHPALRDVVVGASIDAHGTPAASIVGDSDAARAWVVDHVSGYHHVAATCRPGLVTDAEGAVFGYEGLYVCDASGFPRVPESNPYVAVIRLAERRVKRWS
jgi:choline dehydrogenase-like flavoprotein